MSITQAPAATPHPEEIIDLTHPTDKYLRTDMLPHIWCPGCGLGIVLTAYLKALDDAGIPENNRAVVSGIGCTGRASSYLKMDAYHTTHGRAIAFATGLKLSNPDLSVTVLSGDGDLFAIGGNHFIHAARRNMDLKVICVNNFNYGMTGGQGGPTTPHEAKTSTTPYGCAEYPFNLCALAASCGAVYVARWTALDTRRLRSSIAEALKKKGFSFIEVIAPCPTSYGRPNQIGSGVDEMRFYRGHWHLAEENIFLEDAEAPHKVDIGLRTDITVGKFLDVEKPTFLESYNDVVMKKVKGK
jgi:2-oxoglutarate ferredoxin oxidoreductase subunit beta